MFHRDKQDTHSINTQHSAGMGSVLSQNPKVLFSVYWGREDDKLRDSTLGTHIAREINEMNFWDIINGKEQTHSSSRREYDRGCQSFQQEGETAFMLKLVISVAYLALVGMLCNWACCYTHLFLEMVFPVQCFFWIELNIRTPVGGWKTSFLALLFWHKTKKGSSNNVAWRRF